MPHSLIKCSSLRFQSALSCALFAAVLGTAMAEPQASAAQRSGDLSEATTNGANMMPSASSTYSAVREDVLQAYLSAKGILSNVTSGRRQSEPGVASVAEKLLPPITPVSTKTSEVVMSAMSFIGIPYRWGGSTEETGFDCSGFVRALYGRSVGLLLPRRAVEQAAATFPVQRTDMKPGDLVFFNTMKRSFSHVGVYVGEGRFIHSPRSGSSIRIESMGNTYWSKRFNGARRVDVAD